MKKPARLTCTALFLSLFGLLCLSSQAWAQVARFEETDPSVTFTSGWSEDGSWPWSGGTAAFSTTAGAQATFIFTGPSVNWIGGRGSGTGIASVSLDGVPVAQVDTYSKTTEVRVTMFTINGLANTTHTLTIEATGQKNPASTSPLVIVDAFDVPGPAVSRLQETDPNVAFTPGWVEDNTVNSTIPGITNGWLPNISIRAWSAGAAALSTTAGAQATFAFTGTSITWIGARGTQSGIANVYLDGTFVAKIDMYSSTEQIQAAVFTQTGLANAPHTLTIEVTGQQNPAAQNALVVVDGFEVTSPGMQIQETDPSIVYDSEWITGNRDKAYSEGTAAETAVAGAQATFTFTGTGVSWIGARGPQTGIARVYLDGRFVDEIDTYAPTEGIQETLYTATGLAAGSHTLMIEATGQRNLVSTNSWVLIDAFNVTP